MERSMIDIQKEIREALQNGYSWSLSYSGKMPACNWCYQIGRILSSEGCICLDKEYTIFVHQLQAITISKFHVKSNGIYTAKVAINQSVISDYHRLSQHDAIATLEYSVPFETALMEQELLSTGWIAFQVTPENAIVQAFSQFNNPAIFEKEDYIIALYYNAEITPDFKVSPDTFNTMKYQSKSSFD